MRDDHMLAAHMNCLPRRLVHWGGSIGASTGRFAATMLERLRARLPRLSEATELG